MNSEKVLVKGMLTMKESPLIIKSKKFALDVIKACKELRNAKCEGALISQFLRSGTSVGANIRRIAKQTLLLSFKYRLRNVLKANIG